MQFAKGAHAIARVAAQAVSDPGAAADIQDTQAAWVCNSSSKNLVLKTIPFLERFLQKHKITKNNPPPKRTSRNPLKKPKIHHGKGLQDYLVARKKIENSVPTSKKPISPPLLQHPEGFSQTPSLRLHPVSFAALFATLLHASSRPERH